MEIKTSQIRELANLLPAEMAEKVKRLIPFPFIGRDVTGECVFKLINNGRIHIDIYYGGEQIGFAGRCVEFLPTMQGNFHAPQGRFLGSEYPFEFRVFKLED